MTSGSGAANEDLFPAFREFAVATGLVNTSRGTLAARIPRILGSGKTRAIGLDAPPAPIERKMELVGLKKLDLNFTADVLAEMARVEHEIADMTKALTREENVRRLAMEALDRIDARHGVLDRRFFADRLILVPNKSALEWSWSVTPHYAIVKKIPPDVHYLVASFQAAQQLIAELTLPTAAFGKRLVLAWQLARHFSENDDVLITEVMRMYNVAGQDDRFWQQPSRQFFSDLPDAAFVVNLINWRRTAEDSPYEFIPATLNQTQGKTGRVFYLPMNEVGTEVRPMIYLRARKSREQ